MRKLIICVGFFVPVILLGQNVGVGTTSPSEKLDVNGNINVTGTIKANGVDGTANQVLMKNSSGNMAWGDLCEFKKFTSFTNAVAGQTWQVPATGVSKIFVEVWGGGGGGNNFAGGGGGGYAAAVIPVDPNEIITINVGAGGVGTAATAAFNGEESRVTRGSNILHIRAFGGQRANLTSAGGGGEYATNGGSTLISYMGRNGLSGTVTEENYAQSAATTFLRLFKYGNGGDSGNGPGTGGKGGYRIINAGTSTVISNIDAAYTSAPGGGGAGGITGEDGAKGLVIIHY